ncbi:MAG: LON peptidase substrate-binding domain-containing protein [Phycisphaeraceae bacterium]
MTEAGNINYQQPIPLFPLASCVLLPHATIRLHIFEPRYRDMVADALAGDQLIAMATFNDPAWKSNYAENPIIHHAVCVGYILRHNILPDGRYNILLQGIARATIKSELEHNPYRIAMLQDLEQNNNTKPVMEIDLHDTRQHLDTLIHDDTLSQLASVQALRNGLCNDIPTPALVDLATLTICQDSPSRYTILAEPDPHARATWLLNHLTQLKQTVTNALRSNTGDPDSGIYYN